MDGFSGGSVCVKRARSFDVLPVSKVSRGGQRVVAARITELARPEQNPLGGLSVDDVHAAFSSAGTIEKIVCGSGPRTGPPLTHVDALVQFQSPVSADIAVQQWAGASLTGDRHHVLIEIRYSRHTELTVQSNSRCKDYANPFPGCSLESSTLSSTDMAAVRRPSPAPGTSHVVLARMTNLRCPEQNPLGGITVEAVHRVFSMVGVIEKIVCSSSPKTGPPLTCVDAMVQFGTEADAASCIQALQGWSLTGDSFFTMKVEFSRLQELHVKANNDRAWDYTSEPSGAATCASQSLGGQSLGTRSLGYRSLGDQHFSDQLLAGKPPGDPSLGDQTLAASLFHCAPALLSSPALSILPANVGGQACRAGCCAGLGQSIVNGQRVVVAHIADLYQPEQNPLGGLTVDHVQAAFSVVGAVEKIVCCSSPKTGAPLMHVDAMVQFESAEAAAVVVAAFSGQSLTGDGRNNMSVEFSRNPELVVRQSNSRARDYTAVEASAPANAGGGLGGLVGSSPLGPGTSQPQPLASAHTRSFTSGAGSARVIAAHLHNLRRPDEGPLGGLDVEVVHEVIGQVGEIQKIVCMTTPKSTPLKSVTALVQFAFAEAADMAFHVLEGTSLTGDGHNNITLQRSDRAELQVKSNCQRSWDYVLQPSSEGMGGLRAYDPLRFGK